METARRKRTYEEMEQHFGTHELSTSKTDYSASSSEDIDCGDDSESSAAIVQQISTTGAVAKVPTKRGTLQKFLIGSKLLTEMGFTY